jgi:hypothetical protein
VRRTQVNDPIRHSPEETWRLEFQSFRGAPHKKKPIGLRDGTTVEVGARHDGAGYYVTEGKQKHHSTVSLYMCAGLDGIESVRKDDRDERVVIVTDRHGAFAAYHLGTRVAADSSSSPEGRRCGSWWARRAPPESSGTRWARRGSKAEAPASGRITKGGQQPCEATRQRRFGGRSTVRGGD